MPAHHPRGHALGRLGRAAVQQLAAQGVPTRVLCRHEISDASRTSASADGTASSAEVMAFLSTLPAVTLVQGDVTDPASLGVLMEGCTACLALYGAVRTFKASDLLPFVDQSLERTHARQVNYEGVRNILAAARASEGCKRVVRITGKGEAPWSFFTILINGVGSFAKAWNYAGETVLRDPEEAGDVEYTIIRPGIMSAAPVQARSLALADNGDDLKVAPNSHEAVAALCIRSLFYPNAARATLTAMTVPSGEGADTWDPLLEAVRADTRAFPARDELVAVHYKAVRAVAGGGLVAVITGLMSVIAILVR